jgi:hypothetical protein
MRILALTTAIAALLISSSAAQAADKIDATQHVLVNYTASATCHDQNGMTIPVISTENSMEKAAANANQMVTILESVGDQKHWAICDPVLIDPTPEVALN